MAIKKSDMLFSFCLSALIFIMCYTYKGKFSLLVFLIGCLSEIGLCFILKQNNKNNKPKL